MDELQSQVDQLRDEVVQNSPKHKSAQLQQQILEVNPRKLSWLLTKFWTNADSGNLKLGM